MFYIKVQHALKLDSAAATTIPSDLQRRFSISTFRRDENALVDRSISKPQEHINHPHILLVEDNVVNQRVLGKQLEKAGCVVHIANNGVEALSILTSANAQHKEGKRVIKVDIVLYVIPQPIYR